MCKQKPEINNWIRGELQISTEQLILIHRLIEKKVSQQ